MTSVPKLKAHENYSELTFVIESLLVSEYLSTCLDGKETDAKNICRKSKIKTGVVY